MIDEKAVWYLSHPVAPDTRFTYEQNLDHALHMANLCYNEGFRVYVPWHTLCLIMPDDVPENRKIGLEVDCALARMTGLMILTGHKISSGMTAELEALKENPDPFWIDGTGLNDKAFTALLQRYRNLIRA